MSYRTFIAVAVAVISVSAFAHGDHAKQHAHEFKVMTDVAAQLEIGMPIVVAPGSLPASNALASLNLKDGRCEITLGTERAVPALAKFYDNALWPKFLAYHETAHCLLYAQQDQLTGQDNLTSFEDKVLRDFLAMHYIELDPDAVEGFAGNLNVTYHEMFADAIGVMMLLRDGHSVDDLKFIRQFRLATAFGSSHDTVKAIDRLLIEMAKTGLPQDLKGMTQLAKQVAIVSAFERMSLGKATGDGTTFLVGPYMISMLKNAYNQAHKGVLRTESYMMVNPAALGDMKSYEAVKYTLIEKDVSKFADDKAYVEAWVKSQYSLSMTDWNTLVNQLSVKLETIYLAK